LLKKFLSEKSQPSLLVLLVQKEVAERIARSTKESILSLSIKVYGTPSYLKTVPRGAFSPPPTVDSAILKIADVSRKNFTAAAEEKRFFEIVRAGFAQKRKLLVRNLKKILGAESADILQNVGISKNTRAEDVPLEQWLALTKEGVKVVI
jgi:16S rRNA (adenine1518-N6/adenine1519-N6)-dimethyltransferase